MNSIFKVDGRLRRGSIIEDLGEHLRVKLIVDVHPTVVVAGKNPGAGFRRDNSRGKNAWVRFDPIVETRVIPRDHMTDHKEWPKGLAVLGEIAIALLGPLVEKLMKKALEAGGIGAARTRPKLSPEVIRHEIEAVGAPMPEDHEFDEMCKDTWSRLISGNKRRVKNNSAITGIVAPRAPVADGTKPENKEPENKETENKETELNDDGSYKEPESIPEGQFFSRYYGLLKDNQENRAAHTARENGWPHEVMDGATLTRKNREGGHTLAFMARNKFDKEKHGLPRN